MSKACTVCVTIFSTGGKFHWFQIYRVTHSYSSRPFLCVLGSKERASEPVHKVSLGATTSHNVTSDYLMIHGRIICRGTMGIAMRAICSRGSPASIIFRPVTLSEAANASYVSLKEGGRGTSLDAVSCPPHALPREKWSTYKISLHAQSQIP